MEPTSSPDNARQSRGLARFWPVHGMPAPAQRHSDEDPDASLDDDHQVSGPPAVSHSGSAQAAAAAQLAAQNAQNAADGHEDALAGDTQMVALGSRRGFEANGARAWTGNQGGAFPPVESERAPRNGDQPPRHGGGPVPNGQPASRSPFAMPPASPGAPGPSLADQLAPRPPFAAQAAAPTSGAPEPFRPASPFAPQAPGTPMSSAPRPPGQSDDTPRGAASVPASSRRHIADDEPDDAPEPPAQAQAQTHAPAQAHGPAMAQSQAQPPVQARPATGWASVPTSGIPTLSGPGPTGAGPAFTAPPADDEAAGTGRDRAAEDRAADDRAAAGRADDRTAGDRAGEDRPIEDRAGDDRAPGRAFNRAAAGNDRTAGAAAAEDEEADDRAETGVPSPAADNARLNGRKPELDADRETRHETGHEAEEPAGRAARRSASLADADAELPRAGRRAAQTSPAADGPLRPGDVNLSQIAFWDEEAIAHFRSKWQEVKADFVDDPETALTRAHDLLTDAVNELTEALLAERDELDPMRNTSTPDTESMRMAMRGYREFLDRILAL